MAAVSLFWNKNIADVTSCENALYAGAVVCQLPVPFVCQHVTRASERAIIIALGQC